MSLDNIRVQDTAEVVLIDGDGNHYFYGCTDEASITKEVEKELLTCGIGNKQVGVLWAGQSYSVTVTPLYFQNKIMELQTGNTFQSTSFDAWKEEEGIAVDDGGGDAIVNITGTPIDDTVYVVDNRNTQKSATYDDGTGDVTVTDGSIGENYHILYQETEANADVLDLDAEKFPENVHIQLRTIAYKPDTEEVVADIYWDFPKCSPDGALDLAMAKGTNSQTPLTFDILNNSGSYGKYVVVPRA